MLLAAIALAIPMRFHLPPQPRREVYGNVMIDRATAGGAVKPVMFTHWTHRTRYTCRVCHLELDFSFQRNGTEITEEANRHGQYCGACHDGKVAFGHTPDNCDRCHSGDVAAADVGKLDALPWSVFGNGVNWTRALATGAIKPVGSLTGDSATIQLDRTLTIEADWNFVPPAIFPHAEHERWLDCANCHPSIFNVKKKSTQQFSMQHVLAGEFCGTCHRRVAFPLHDCRRCHPTMKNEPEL